MKIALVHLSDMHIKVSSNIDNNKIESIAKLIDFYSKTNDKIIVTITGDLAFSGRNDEYTIIYDNIITKLKTKAKYDFEIAICPGNHDCNFSLNNEVRGDLIKTVLDKQSTTNGHIEIITSVQNEYFEFENKVSNNINRQSKINGIYVYDDIKVIIHSLNNVWMTNINCEPAKTYIDPEAFRLNGYDDYLPILIMHQTCNWFMPDLNRRVRNELSKNYSFVLTGHEHESSDHIIKQPQTEEDVVMIEGGELSPFQENNKSSFSVIIIDSDINAYCKQDYTYCNDKQLYKLNNCNDEIFTEYTKKESRAVLYEIKNKQMKYLYDPGAPFVHPSDKKLSLEDIFIYPDVKEEQTITSDKKRLKRNIGFDVIFNQKDIKLVLSGGERSGKTSICKKIYLEKYFGRKIPILIDGSKITKTSKLEIEKLIEKKFIEQYTSTDIDSFRQADKTDKAIIIDDFHLANIKNKERFHILHYLSENYDNIYIFVDEYLKYDELTDGDSSKEGVLSNYKYFSIQEFGYAKRGELVNSWYKIGYEGDINQYYRSVDAANKVLNTLIIKNFVPSYPFYLYTALSAIDATSSNQIVESSYGYYYNILLTMSLAKINNKPDEVDLRTNYLTELSYFMKVHDSSTITEDQFLTFHKFYCDKYQIDIDDLSSKTLLFEFTNASILDKENGSIFFKYKYFYYFFFAKFISINFNECKINEIFTKLCESLHNESSSNILMFLTHLSKDKKIIDTIVEKSNCIFEKNAPIRLEDDAITVNNLIGSIPQFQIEENNVDETRSASLEMKDKICDDLNGHERYSGKCIDIKDDNEVSLTADELIKSISATYKTLDIIGQILKNYHGSIPKDQKTALCKQGFELPLRALSDYFSLISQNRDSIIEEMKQELLRKKSKIATSSDADTFIKQILFRISEVICLSFIQKTSRSIGSDKLKQTYKDVVELNKSNAMLLIDISIKIDSSENLPIQEIKNLADRFKGSIIAFSILRDIVAHRLYMYKYDYKIVQSACKAVDINYKSQQNIRVSAIQSGESHS